MKQITIQINCGETTCGVKDTGITCKFFATRKWGTVPFCALFDKELYDDVEGSWVQRCPQCLKEVK